MLHTEQSPRSDCVRRFGGCRCCCFRLFSTAEMIGFNVDIPSWAFARQCCHSSAIRLTSFFVQSTDMGISLAYTEVPSWAFARQCCHTSAIRLTSFFVQSTIPAFVGCSVFFTTRSVDDSCFRRLFRHSSFLVQLLRLASLTIFKARFRVLIFVLFKRR